MAEDTALDDTTYYNAQPVAAQVQLNWAEIGQNFSDMLQGEVTARQEKKAAIDKDTREQIRTINEVQQGQNATANQWWLRGSQEMINQLSMANGMLKSGKLPPSEYTIMRQNMSDGVDDIIGVYTDFNKVYEDRMSRMQNKESQDIEPFLMEMLEGFGNFHETAIVIDPTTGVMALAGVDDQGMIIDDPNKIRSTTALKGMLGTEYDRYDLSAATDEYASKVGVWEEVINVVPTRYRKGYRAIVSDPSRKPVTVEELQGMGMTAEEAAIAVEQYNLYKASEDYFLSSVMADWQTKSSILTNHIDVYTDTETGEKIPYTFTFDEATRQPNEILLTYNEAGRIEPDFTDEQEEAIKLAIRTDVRNKFDKKITGAVTVAAPVVSESERAEGRQQKTNRDYVTNITQLYSGTREQFETAADFIRTISDGKIVDLTRDNSGVTVIYDNGNSETLAFSGKNESNWVIANANKLLKNEISDVKGTLDASGALTGATSAYEAFELNADGTPKVVKGETIPISYTSKGDKLITEDISDTVQRELTNDLTASVNSNEIFVVDDETVSIGRIEAVLRGIPNVGEDFSVVTFGGGWGGDEIVIKVDGKIIAGPYNFDKKNKDKIPSYKKDLIAKVVNYYRTVTPTETQEEDFKARQQQTRGGKLVTQEGELN